MTLPNYFTLAKIASQHSPERYGVGAVIVGPKPVSMGFNYIKSHPLYANGVTTFSIHAEVSAILKSRTDISGCTIYVYREDRLGNIASAKPCQPCMELILASNLKRIYHTIAAAPYFEVIDL